MKYKNILFIFLYSSASNKQSFNGKQGFFFWIIDPLGGKHRSCREWPLYLPSFVDPIGWCHSSVQKNVPDGLFQCYPANFSFMPA